MTPSKAKVVFATHMQESRKRKLTEYELKQLSQARQVLRRSRKPAMNAPSGSWEFVQTVAARYGISVSRNRPGDGKTRYSFYKVDAQGRETKHLYTAVGIKDAMTYVNAFRDGKENPFNSRKRKNNPAGTLIYGQVDCIYATKKQDHICDDDCKKHGHRYFHEFSSKPKMYGLPDGTLLIKP